MATELSNEMPAAAWKVQRRLRWAQLVLIVATAGVYWAPDKAFTIAIVSLISAVLVIELMINLRSILFRRWLRALDYQVCPQCATPLNDKRNRDECPGCRRPFVLTFVKKTWQPSQPFWG